MPNALSNCLSKLSTKRACESSTNPSVSLTLSPKYPAVALSAPNSPNFNKAPVVLKVPSSFEKLNDPLP